MGVYGNSIMSFLGLNIETALARHSREAKEDRGILIFDRSSCLSCPKLYLSIIVRRLSELERG
jgi:hypothetical protein